MHIRTVMSTSWQFAATVLLAVVLCLLPSRRSEAQSTPKTIPHSATTGVKLPFPPIRVPVTPPNAIRAWGQNLYGQLGTGLPFYAIPTPAPVPGLSNVIAIAGGSNTTGPGTDHSLALESDGTIWAWGGNFGGQLGNGTFNNSSIPMPVMGLANVIAIAAGDEFSAALRSDGTVWTWGENLAGNGSSTFPIQVSGLNGVTAIAAGYSFMLALKSDGTVWAWGYNDDGELGDGTLTDSSTPVQVQGLTNVIAIAASGSYKYYSGHSLALKSDGTVWAWGSNYEGQLGNGSIDMNAHPLPAQVTGSGGVGALSGVVAIACGGGDCFALKSDSSVLAWGDNSHGELGGGTATSYPYGNPLPQYIKTPDGSANLTGVTAIAAGFIFTTILKNGTVLACGDNSYGQLGMGDFVDVSLPAPVSGPTAVKAIAAGAYHCLALRIDGSVWAWGSNANGELGSLIPLNPPLAQLTNLLTHTTAIAAGSSFSVALQTDGTVWTWGNNDEDALGYNSPTTPPYVTFTTTPAQVSGITNAVAVTCDGDYIFVLTSDGYVLTIGLNNIYQIGGLPTIKAISAGAGDSYPASGYFLALGVDGSVWGWGYNYNGILGTSVANGHETTTPVQIGGLSDVVAIASGDTFCLALTPDGTVWAWGYNACGQLGDGTMTNHYPPAPVIGLTNIIAISAGDSNSLALKSDGTVWAWGDNSFGELGNGTTTKSATPVQVSGLTNVVAIAANHSYEPGTSFCLALKSDGTVWAWGDNSYGQLGDGTYTPRFTPVKTLGVTGATAIACGTSHSFALTPANTVAGTVVLQGMHSGVAAQPITFAFRSSDGDVFYQEALIDSSGAFAFADIPAGDYTMAIKGDRWLQKTIGVNNLSGSVTGVNITLLSGDINNDNVVDLKDFSYLAQAFGAIPGATGWNAQADLNFDNVIDLSDFSLLAANFGRAGEP